MMYELPPQVQGSSDLLAIRDYLVRLARDLDRLNGSEQITELVSKATTKVQKEAAKSIQDQATTLKSLIVKNAHTIEAYADEITTDLHSHYVAISDYGNYYEQIETQVQQTARDTVETYHYTEAIEGLNSFMSDLNGQIRRGIIEDPDDPNVHHLGIAISENIKFTGQTVDVGGVTYYEIGDKQTFGLYTSKGWQFWIDGQKMGWFDSEDSMLHVANIVVEDVLQIGAHWQISTTNGFGLRYIGG